MQELMSTLIISILIIKSQEFLVLESILNWKASDMIDLILISAILASGSCELW